MRYRSRCEIQFKPTTLTPYNDGMAPEKWSVGFLGLLLAVTLTLLYVDFEYDTAVNIARGVCVVLALFMIIGVIVPVRRRMARKEEEPPA